MRTWIKAVLWLIVLFVIVCCVCLGGQEATGAFTPGPTCDTYYFGRDLRRCPPFHEFSSLRQECVPIGNAGCTAVARSATTLGVGSLADKRKARQLLEEQAIVLLAESRNDKLYQDSILNLTQTVLPKHITNQV